MSEKSEKNTKNTEDTKLVKVTLIIRKSLFLPNHVILKNILKTCGYLIFSNFSYYCDIEDGGIEDYVQPNEK